MCAEYHISSSDNVVWLRFEQPTMQNKKKVTAPASDGLADLLHDLGAVCTKNKLYWKIELANWSESYTALTKSGVDPTPAATVQRYEKGLTGEIAALSGFATLLVGADLCFYLIRHLLHMHSTSETRIYLGLLLLVNIFLAISVKSYSFVPISIGVLILVCLHIENWWIWQLADWLALFYVGATSVLFHRRYASEKEKNLWYINLPWESNWQIERSKT